ncbi:cytochrome P450 [Sistotremastrum suecicum HHB10207 ss-3]|uniref:Cytochrome P450 n=1 Tax=Sistotremastrum suecicum HHB10207 ss-3 TaxID=1314776 RepID=A0A165ZL50_9AGAM|nr:cytochrome P450 [Sistotremastrum suecicum HHB10207 ss-3]
MLGDLYQAFGPRLFYFLIGAPIFIFLLSKIYLLRKRGMRNGLKKPPGPKGWPLIGNLLDMPTSNQYLTYMDWGKKYGDVVGVDICGRPILILNSRQAIHDLLIKRSAIYSNRPRMELLNTWGRWDWTLVLMQGSEEMHRQRRMLGQCLNKGMIPRYHAAIQREALDFCLRLAKTPENYKELIDHMSGANIMMITYGHKVKEEADENVERVHDVFSEFIKLGNAGSHIVDFFPALSALPSWVFGLDFAKTMKRLASLMDSSLIDPYFQGIREIETGVAKSPSMLHTLLDAYTQDDGSVEHERSIQAATGVAYLGIALIAGGDTTMITICTFLLAMMLYPDAQRKAKAEIDALLKNERLPTFDDRKSLPYVEATMNEVFRWKPTAPLAVAHQSTEDDVYNGMFIPAGTTIFPNTWACLQNEDDFPEPDVFKPERYLDGVKLKEGSVLAKEFAFGYGRRVCSGKHLADAIVWMNLSLLLAAFDISLPTDRSGNPIMPDLDYEYGATTVHPKPFQCKISLRSEKYAELLRGSLNASEGADRSN